MNYMKLKHDVQSKIREKEEEHEKKRIAAL